MSKNGWNGWNGWKWLKMNGNSLKSPGIAEMVEIFWKWLEIARNGQE